MEQPECEPNITFDEMSDYTDSDSDNEDYSRNREEIIKKDRIRSGIDTLADLDQLKGSMNTMYVRTNAQPQSIR